MAQGRGAGGAPISNAIKEKIVIPNADGLHLIKSLWRWDVQSEPTVNMMRVVIEALREEQEPDLLARLKDIINNFKSQNKKIVVIRYGK